MGNQPIIRTEKVSIHCTTYVKFKETTLKLITVKPVVQCWKLYSCGTVAA
jgi:hypothetical protein